ncbi:hypothetical protein C0Q70_14919 [Pomacea canaliculata]|uniref:Uncharacterized protein n=1 Tax=Pomacea canaliculata TaxID=400727 RepID=A0A2T7NTG8_POMCA|nr:hypothetical protein C0Q70_14919 [Pomacea canaliculata]
MARAHLTSPGMCRSSRPHGKGRQRPAGLGSCQHHHSAMGSENTATYRGKKTTFVGQRQRTVCAPEKKNQRADGSYNW